MTEPTATGWHWMAECQDCPTTTDPDYGHQVKVHCIRRHRGTVALWELRHEREHPGHNVTVSQTLSIHFAAESLNTEVLAMLFGEDFPR